MSIASEITRLQGAKADLATAIEGKGVTVPSATKLDGYADLVDAISQGGGGTLGTKTITANGTYNASSDGYDGYSQVVAAVPASAVDQGMKVINSNGQHDVVGYAVAAVVVPNTYSASDEGKVVDNGALVAQTSDTVTANDTYDTTLINSLTVNVSGGAFTGDDYYDRIISTEKLEINTQFAISGGYFFTYLHAPTICLWGATGASGQYAAQNYFRGNTYLKTFVAPNLTRMCRDMFLGCTNVEAIDLSNVTTFDATSIAEAGKLTMLVNRKNSVATLNNISTFNNTPFASGGTGGTLYVPQAVISSYQSASNWSTILGYTNNQIKSIESTHTDPTAPIDLTLYYADGTPISA